ncbi:MAG: hypothetical protein ACTSU2_09345 [Promethearchaeota archaeon]
MVENYQNYQNKKEKIVWGIREINEIHELLRARKYTARLAGLLLMGFIYNLWQFWREVRTNCKYKKEYLNQALFLEVVSHII